MPGTEQLRRICQVGASLPIFQPTCGSDQFPTDSRNLLRASCRFEVVIAGDPCQSPDRFTRIDIESAKLLIGVGNEVEEPG